MTIEVDKTQESHTQKFLAILIIPENFNTFIEKICLNCKKVKVANIYEAMKMVLVTTLK